MCTQRTGTYCNRTSSQVSGSLEFPLHKPEATRPVPGLLEEKMNFLFTPPTIIETIYGKGAGKIPRLSLTSWDLLKLIFIQKGVIHFVGWGVDFLNKEVLVTSSRYRYTLQWNLISGKFIPRSNLESSANQASSSPLHSDPKKLPTHPSLLTKPLPKERNDPLHPHLSGTQSATPHLRPPSLTFSQDAGA